MFLLFLLKRFFFNSNYAVVLQNCNFPNSSKIQVKLNIKKKKKKKSLNPWGSFMVMHGWRWIRGHPRGCPSAALPCKAMLHSQMYPHATGCLVVPLAAKWKLIVFLWVRDIISTSTQSFKKLSLSQYSWLQCQKIPFRKAPKSLAFISWMKIMTVLFSRCQSFILKKVKPTGRLQEKHKEIAYTIQLDWPVVNILPHVCLLSVYSWYLHIHTHFVQHLRAFKELFAGVIILHPKYFGIYLLIKKALPFITTVQWSYSLNFTTNIVLLSNKIQPTFRFLHLSQ